MKILGSLYANHPDQEKREIARVFSSLSSLLLCLIVSLSMHVIFTKAEKK